MTEITRELARYIHSTQLDTLPSVVRHEGVRALVNWLGCAAGGAREEDVLLMLDFLAGFNGRRDAVVIGHKRKLDMLNAAFLNSMSSGSLAFGDTHYATVAHPTSPTAAAVLALAAQGPLSGEDLLVGLILGIEIQCRVGNILCTPPAQCQVGLSMKGLAGVIGAAVAAAKALKLDANGVATAIGHAANQASGLREGQSSMASHFTYGHSARCGLQAALLAARGLECTQTMIEGVKGFAVSYSTQPNFDAAVAGLGTDFEILQLAYKPYPSGFVIHPIIDACLEVAENHTLDPARIARVELTINPLAAKLTNRVDPVDRGQALVSFQHWSAVALLQREAGIAQVEDKVIHDPAVAALRRKITFECDDALPRGAARARVLLDDGSVFAAHVPYCRGSAERPMSDEDLTVKTRGQLKTAYSARATERILRTGWGIADVPDVGALCRTLARGS